MRIFVFLLAAAAATPAFSAPAPVPKEALKALQVARGKPCSRGFVFMDGKFISPPYVVKRYGTAIMINDIQVTAPLMSWEAFVKTQQDVKTVRPEPQPGAGGGSSYSQPAPSVASEDEDPLADLFSDVETPAKPAAKSSSRYSSSRGAQGTAAAEVPALNGPFVHNDASKKLLDKLNRYRTDVNVLLINGGFVFFGSRYSRVSGDSREAHRLIAALPDLLRSAESGRQLLMKLREGGFHYLTEEIANDLYANRLQYPKLAARARREQSEAFLQTSF